MSSTYTSSIIQDGVVQSSMLQIFTCPKPPFSRSSTFTTSTVMLPKNSMLQAFTCLKPP